MSELAVRHNDIAETAPAGSRALGVRVKPIIRLGMGYRDEQRRGAPVKTDYFTVRGDDRAVQKFTDQLGDKPKAVPILLPSTLDQALRIEYVAFKGDGSPGGGNMVARGEANFAHRDYVGGPDLLTVWNQDGTVDQVETHGVDAMTRQPLDEIANDLGLELQTTFRFTIPNVLGFGSFAEISTKGKESTDNLWLKLRDWYGMFGGRVTFALQPHLVLRSSTARPVVKDRETQETRRTKTTIYVLDLVNTESLDETFQRLSDRASLMPGGSPQAALYGPDRGDDRVRIPPQIPPPSPGQADAEAPQSPPAAAAVEDEADTSAPPVAAASADFDQDPATATFEPPPSVQAAAQTDLVMSAAGETRYHANTKTHGGRTIAEVWEIDPSYVRRTAAEASREDLRAAAGVWVAEMEAKP